VDIGKKGAARRWFLPLPRGGQVGWWTYDRSL